jgi:hypothetical protein
MCNALVVHAVEKKTIRVGIKIRELSAIVDRWEAEGTGVPQSAFPCT